MGMTAESVESLICALITTAITTTNQQSDDKTIWCDNHDYSRVWRIRKQHEDYVNYKQNPNKIQKNN